MDSQMQQALTMTRRQLFGRSAVGAGAAALATLLGKDLMAAEPVPEPRRRICGTLPRGPGA